MNKFIKFILALFGIGLASAAGVEIYDQQQIAALPAEYLLKADKSKVLVSEEIDWKIYDEKGNLVEDKGRGVKYLYASDVEVGQASIKVGNKTIKEDLTKRTKNSQFFKKGEKDGKEEFEAKIYTGEPFYKDGKTWKQTEMAITTKDAFDLQMNQGIVAKLFNQKALAACGTSGDPCYSGAGDGDVSNLISTGNDQAAWDSVHDGTTGVSYSYTYTSSRTRTNNEADPFIVIVRNYYPVDTSAIDDGATITSAAFYAYYTGSQLDEDNDGDDFVRLVQTDQPSATTLAKADFNNCGATNNPTAGATDKDITGLSSGYQTFTLNATGLTWISKTSYTMFGLREGHDAKDSPIAAGANNYIEWNNSEYTGTTRDPYLTVNFTVSGAARRIIITE